MGAGVDPSEYDHVDLDLLLEQADQERSGLTSSRPPAAREYSTSRQELLLSQVRRALDAAAAKRENASMRERRLRRSADRLLEQARRASELGRTGYARQSLAWRNSIKEHAAELDAEQAELRAEQERLTDLARRLQATLTGAGLDEPLLTVPAAAPEPVLAADPVLADGPLSPDDAMLPETVSLADGLLTGPAGDSTGTAAIRKPGELVPVSEPAELLQLAKRPPLNPLAGPEPPSGAELC